MTAKRRVPHAFKLAQTGGAAGLILPLELLARLGVAKGDTIYAVDRPGGVRLTVADADFAAQMDVARRVMKDRWSALRELAK